MPLPLIPVVILGASAAAAAKGAFDTVVGLSQIAEEQARYKRHRATYKAAERKYAGERAILEQRLADLGKARLQAMGTLGRAVEFIRRARLTTTPFDEKVKVTEEELERWEGVAVAASDVLKGLASGAGAGAATTLGAYGLVGTFGAASTGTAIASLSGAAATNATLAWLGGGALAAGGGGMALGTIVLGGVVAGPAVLVSGFFVAAQAERVKTEVRRHIAEMEIAKAKMWRQEGEFAAIRARADELQLAILRLAVQIEELLTVADAASDEEMYQVVRLAKGLADMVKLPALHQAASTMTGAPV